MEYQPAHRRTDGQGPQLDTIVAAATPPGRGGVGIVRVSGSLAPRIARALFGTLPPARRALLARFDDALGQPIDTGLALYFPAPRSFTGEDVLELHGHGGPVVVGMLIERVLELGARRAAPGEFSQRAYLNDKLDLAQAEAIADLIDASSAAAARAAVRSLQGEFSARVHELVEAVTLLRMHVEAAIDFPEEEIDFLADAALQARLREVQGLSAELLRAAGHGRLLTEGLNVVIAGAPNAGKSTLLNRLAGYDAAIVTEQPGTTRDVLRERIDLDGLPVQLLDTAGLRATQDAIEREGIRRATAAMRQADQVLLIIDAVADPTARARIELAGQLPADVPVTLVYNKIDLPWARELAQSPRLEVSAATGAGFDALREHLKRSAGFVADAPGTLTARARHVTALRQAQAHIEAAAARLVEQRAGELMAEELRAAQRVLGEITGEVSSDELLGRIFSSFCIGK
jgi:tRNA modification GTPase